jgi:phosphatidate cytidylyltransferase
VPELGVPERRLAEGWAAGLRLRIISAVVMAAAVLLAILAGPLAFAVFVAVGAAILSWEWARLCGDGRFGAAGAALAASSVAAVGLAAFGWPGIALLLALPATALVHFLARRVLVPGARGGAAGWVAGGALYITLPVVALVWLRSDPGGARLILWLMATVWATDIGAFFAGRLIGGPKLAPRISPKKTWAGLIGGMASAGMVGVIADLSVPGASTTLAAAGVMLAVVAQAGDLGESLVKRRFGAKDSSSLIPGHGGLLDRVDGLLAAAVALAAWQWFSSGGGVLSWR